jgi:hypothetical protein
MRESRLIRQRTGTAGVVEARKAKPASDQDRAEQFAPVAAARPPAPNIPATPL